MGKQDKQCFFDIVTVEEEAAQRQARIDEIRKKRIETLIGCWEVLSSCNRDMKGNVALNKTLLAQTVESYIEDYEALVGKCKIPDRIQRPKIAGLMAASVMRCKPLQIIDHSVEGARVSRHNEFFAAWVGLSICSENYDEEALSGIYKNPMWGTWFSDLVYFLREVPSGDSLIMVFNTFSLAYFPDNLSDQ